MSTQRYRIETYTYPWRGTTKTATQIVFRDGLVYQFAHRVHSHDAKVVAERLLAQWDGSEEMIRDAIRSEMKRRGWTVYRLAKESGVSQGRLHEWLADPDKTMTLANVERLMAALGLEVKAKKGRK